MFDQSEITGLAEFFSKFSTYVEIYPKVTKIDPNDLNNSKDQPSQVKKFRSNIYQETLNFQLLADWLKLILVGLSLFFDLYDYLH